jgi:hypothetical protein
LSRAPSQQITVTIEDIDGTECRVAFMQQF